MEERAWRGSMCASLQVHCKGEEKGSGIWRVMLFFFFFNLGKIRRSCGDGDGECFTREEKVLMPERGGDPWSHVFLDERTGYSTQAKEQGQAMLSSQ